MRHEYAYRKRLLRLLAAGFDACGYGVQALRRRGPAALPPAPRRVLLVRLDHLGDVLFLGPALRALRRGLPRTRLTLLVGPWAAPLLQGTGLVDELRVLEAPWFVRPPRRGGVRAWWETLRWVRGQHFDAAIDFRGDFRHILWLALARIPVRLGYGRTGGGFLLTHPVPHRAVHEVERDLDLVRVLAPAAIPGPLEPPLPSAEDAGHVERLLQEAGCGAGRRFVVFHVTAGYPAKQWESEKLARTMELVRRALDVEVVVVGAATELAAIRAVTQHMREPPPVLAGRTSLLQLAALLARAAGFVGHDSGPGHLAIAVRIPAVLLYSGVNHLSAWGPWDGRARALHVETTCGPCGLAVCDREHECMQALGPEDVLAALESQLGAAEGRHA